MHEYMRALIPSSTVTTFRPADLKLSCLSTFEQVVEANSTKANALDEHMNRRVGLNSLKSWFPGTSQHP
jgi:hypothetical protein